MFSTPGVVLLPRTDSTLAWGPTVFYRVTHHSATQIVAFFNPVAGMGGDEKPATQLREIGLYEKGISLFDAAPGQFTQRTIDQLLDIGNGLFVFGGAYAHPHPILREDLEHFIGWNKNFAPIIQHGKTVTCLGTLDHGFGVSLFRLHLAFKAL